jgi:hypothetical protein
VKVDAISLQILNNNLKSSQVERSNTDKGFQTTIGFVNNKEKIQQEMKVNLLDESPVRTLKTA